MGAVFAELREVNQSLPKLQDRLDRLALAAPVAGVVKNLQVATIGAVLAPGQPVMEIVPIDDEMVAEVRIRPEDIGHLARGQKASVRLSSYDFARFGSLEGRLQSLSASTFESARGEPYYKGVVKLAQSHLGPEPGAMPVLPGMTLEATINTGRRSLLEYLLAPLYRSAAQAFHEH